MSFDVSSGLLGIEAQSIFFSSSTAFGESDRFFDDRRGDSGAARASRRRPLSTASMPAGAASSAGSALLDLDLWEREPTDLLAGFDLDAITAEIEVDDADDETPRIRMERERASTMETHRREAGDHGSPEVQICSFTARIKFITQHCIEHPKDHSSRRGLLKLVSQRRRMMLYYHKKNPAGAVALAKELGIRFRFQDQIQTRAEKYREFTLRQRK